MKKVSLLIIVSSLLIVTVLTGCKPTAVVPEETTATTETTAATEATEEVAKEPVTLEFFSIYSEGEAMGEKEKEIIANFEALNPNITIKWNPIGRDVMAKLRPMLLAGEGPDVTGGIFAFLGEMIKEGFLYDLTEAMNQPGHGTDTLWKDTFYEAVRGPIEKDGKIYAAPVDLSMFGLFYNVNLFKELNLTPPKTWDELLSVSETLKQNGVAPLAVNALPSYHYMAFIWVDIAQIMGGSTAFKNAIMRTDGGTWKTPEFLEAAKKLKDFIDKDYFQEGFQGMDHTAAQTEFVNGRAGMNYNGSWLPSEMAAALPEGFEMNLVKMPWIEGGKGENDLIQAFFQWYGVLNTSKHPKEAVEFVRFLSSPESEALQAEITLMSVKGAGTPKNLSGAIDILDNNKSAPLWYGVDQAQIDKVLQEPIPKLFFGEISAEEFIEQLEENAIKAAGE
ncbi:MAG: extracellular solute-binding protein [Actinobacteria bacterium]|nr:extracellular solute-binding protein [Actinomycetota bacterium]